MADIKFYKANALPASPTSADDGIWFIADGTDNYKHFIITGGVVKELTVTGIKTPTLLEVLTQDNDAEDKTIKFSYDTGGISQTVEIGFLQPSGSLVKIPAFGTPNIYVTPSAFRSDLFNAGILTEDVPGVGIYHNFSINSNTQSRGITADQYFGANYDDNTYVQKKYVDEKVAGAILEWDVEDW